MDTKVHVNNASSYTSLSAAAATSNNDDTISDKREFKAKQDLLGFICGLLSSISLAIGVGCAQALKGSIPQFELTIVRFLVVDILTFVFFLIKGIQPRIKTANISHVIIYAILVVLFNITIYISVNYLPLGVAGSFVRISSMFLTLPLARIVVQEQITFIKIGGVVLGSIGLLFICKPEWFVDINLNPGDTNGFHLTNVTMSNYLNATQEEFTTAALDANFTLNITKSMEENMSHPVSHGHLAFIGYILAFVCAVASATQAILQKSKMNHIEPTILCFWVANIGVVCSLVLSIIFEDLTLPQDVTQWLYLLGQGFGSAAMSLFGVYAIKIGSAIIVAQAFSTQIFFFFIGQYIFLQDIFPSQGLWIEYVGAVLSIVSVSLVPVIQLIQIKCPLKHPRETEINSATDI